MQTTDSPLKKVPCNIVTGFLGVGKTTAILNLLDQKPENERWAVLVNEFGEIGIDGALIQGQQNKGSVFIKELPGGCMCCTNGLPMQMALNQLIARAKPDRLLIEPTGLGHPIEVLETLSNQYNQEAIDIQQTITLIDARKVSNPRYATHETFIQQLKIADRIVANKQDLYDHNTMDELKVYLDSIDLKNTAIASTEHARLDLSWLLGSTGFVTKTTHKHSHADSQNEQGNVSTPTADSVTKAENSGEGFESVGWTIPPSQTFSLTALQSFLHSLNVERMKAVFITEEGIFGFNLADDVLSMFELEEAYESRIEIICDKRNPQWQDRLMECLVA